MRNEKTNLSDDLLINQINVNEENGNNQANTSKTQVNNKRFTIVDYWQLEKNKKSCTNLRRWL